MLVAVYDKLNDKTYIGTKHLVTTDIFGWRVENLKIISDVFPLFHQYTNEWTADEIECDVTSCYWKILIDNPSKFICFKEVDWKG